ncbi:DNA polymerase III subunit alpha [Prevotella sp. PCHR]|uniref:DNA polymerase III subunit alpha n=1 Tax=Xylanibacter caecicola TaxID=2736294 RepID=A0ABX2B222_9BACT|nr:DNA polymerase III subunit alpha [Xylanibacter caecicola]NPE25311.1 DNA polymerase III subunit alpha [Xylanibacter caecicola]
MQDFVHLHVHTYYSILDGQASIKKLVDKAVADGMRGMAVTDHGNMMGIKEFFNYCKKKNSELKEAGKPPFKPILGCEMYVARRTKFNKVKEQGDQGGYHLVVLAKNYQGYKNLIKLVSRAWVDGFYMRPRTDHEDLEKYHEGLIVCSACIAGEVPSKILKGDIKGAEESLLWHKKLFGDDYYLELQRHEVKNPTIRANRETYPLQQQANKVLIELARKHDVKLVCTNDCHFVDEENAEAHDRLLCLSTNKDLDDPKRMLYSKQEWFKTQAEMNEVFDDIPEALANTCEILDKIEPYSIDHAPIMPFFPIPEEFGTEEEYRKRFTEEELFEEFTRDENGNVVMSREEGEKKIQKLGGFDKIYRIKFEADYLAKLAYDGARKMYGEPLSDEVKERINFELYIMKTMGFPGYFLIVQDFINSARDELGVVVGPGRGSAAGSVVAYCLGITKIDPIKYDLLFERFLNPDRISLPDIDTDFDDDGRGKVLDWVTDKYGADKVAHIITYGTMATKLALKDVARVEKLSREMSNHLCKAIPDRLPDGMKMNLTNAIKCVPELREAEISDNPQLRETIAYAKMLEGNVRNTGIHACGTIICRDAISDWVPVSTADDKDNPGKKLLCTQYEGSVIEETGLIKMDFLGLKTLSILKEAVENVRLSTGKTVDLDTIPIDDPLTYKLYCEGRTIGTFQFESAGMQKYLRELQPSVFEDLIAMNALYRPGPMDYIPDFIARKKDPTQIKYDIPCMEKYLKDTYGITVYQEQVMLLSRQLAGFTRGQSDTLRKAMGKKLIEKMNHLEGLFYEGGEKNGHDKKVLQKIWEDWKKFASYAFNKSHATCYSWVAYQTAYMKAHYPAEYMAANMSRNLDNINEITKLMDECKSMGIETLGPDVNESRLKFSVNKAGAIRFGLAAIKGMGASAATAIIKERENNGPYKDIFDLAQRVNLGACNRKCFESMALSGGFDSFKINRERYFGCNQKGENFLDTLIRYGQLYQTEQNEAQNSLFGGLDAVEITTPPVPEAEQWSSIERLNRERDLVGIYLSAHPLDEFEVVIRNICNTKCSELDDKEALAQKAELTFGGIVTNVTDKFTKTGKPCGFITIEDFDGSGELALFGEEWGQWKGMLAQGCSVFIKASCTKRFRDSKFYEMRIGSIKYLQTAKNEMLDKITITMDADAIDDTIVTDLMTIVRANPGTTPLYLQLRNAEERRTVTLRSRNTKIDVKRSLLNFIKENPALEYYIN